VGALPAIHASKTDLERVLRQEAGRSAGGPRQLAVRRWLLAGQAAFAALLLVAAALFADALRELLRLDPGFEATRVLTFRVDPPWGRYPDIATTSEFYRRATEQLTLLPGVEAAGTNNVLPFAGLDVASSRVAIEGAESGRADEQPFVNLQLVSVDYFRAMGIPFVRGRAFAWTDRQDAPPVAIVSERAARRFWGDTDPIGRHLRVVWNQHGTGHGGGLDIWLTVIGIVRNVRFDGVDDETGLDVYAPNMQLFAGDSYVAVRTAMAAETARAHIRAAIDAVDRDQSFFDVQPMKTRVEGSIWQHRVATAVLALFAGIALCLAVIGTYSVAAHAVASQRREIGIRLALGSGAADIGWLMMRRWLVPTSAGVLTGAAAGIISARLLAGLLGLPGFGTSVASVWAASLPLALAVAAAVACYLPVRRTIRRVHLTDALRAE
jgi:putative ABC transport system permease protein